MDKCLGLDLGSSELILQIAEYAADGTLASGPKDYPDVTRVPMVLDRQADIGPDSLHYTLKAVDRLRNQDEPETAFFYHPSPDPVTNTRLALESRDSIDEIRDRIAGLLTQVVADQKQALGVVPSPHNGYGLVASYPLYWADETIDWYRSTLSHVFQNDEVRLPRIEVPLLAHARWAEICARSEERDLLLVDIGAAASQFMFYRRDRSGSHQLVSTDYEFFGGEQFDRALGHYLAEVLHVPGGRLESPVLRLHGKNLKERYSEALTRPRIVQPYPVNVVFDDQPLSQSVELQTSQFNDVAGELVGNFDAILDKALRKLGVDDYKQLIVQVTGGGAYWHFVKVRLKARLPFAYTDADSDGLRTAAGRTLSADWPLFALARGLSLLNQYTVPPLPPRKQGRDIRMVVVLSPGEADLPWTGEAVCDGLSRTLRLKAGHSDGEQESHPGMGMPGKNGGPSGDLLITVRIHTTRRVPMPGIYLLPGPWLETRTGQVNGESNTQLMWRCDESMQPTLTFGRRDERNGWFPDLEVASKLLTSVSRRQGTLRYEKDDRCVITNSSDKVPIVVNTTVLNIDQEIKLCEGDKVAFGDVVWIYHEQASQ